MRRWLSTRICALSLLCIASACAEFDGPEQLRDLRILAVRTEPAEILFSPLYVLFAPEARPAELPLPSYDVAVEVYAYDPRGGRVEGTLALCPEEGDAVCRTYDAEGRVVARALPAVRDELRAALAPRPFDFDIDAAAVAGGRIGPIEKSYTLTTPIVDALISNQAGNPRFTFFSILPRIVADLQNPSRAEPNRERAFKRLPLTLDLFSSELPVEVRQLLFDVLGIVPCNTAPDLATYREGPASCLFPRPPNAQPALIGFNVFTDDTVDQDDLTLNPMRFATSAQLGLRPVLSAQPGEAVWVEPVFRPDAREPYQVFNFDVNNQSFALANRLEDYAVSWHATGGTVPGSSNTQFGQGIPVRWQLRTDGEPDTSELLVVVVRDQRGGVTVGEIEVVYR